MALAIVCTTILGLFYPFLTGKIIDAIYYLGKFREVIKYSVIFLLFFMTHQIFRAIGTLNFISLNNSLTFDIKKKILEKVCFGRYEVINSMENADIIKRLNEDSNAYLNELYYSKIYRVSDYVEFIVLLAFITFINPWYLVVTVVTFPFYLLINKQTEKILNVFETKFIEKNNKLMNWIIEFSDAIEGLRDLGVKAYILGKTRNTTNEYFNVKEQKVKAEWIQKSLTRLLSALLRILYMGTSFLLFRFKALSLGDFVAVFAYMESAIEIFSDLNTQSSLIGKFTAEKKRVNALIELDQEPLESNHRLNIEEREKQCLQVCNFTVIRNASKILDHISTQFSSGNLNILFGESGSGKSTLLIGLSGLLNHEGSIYYNNCLIDSDNIVAYRGLLSFAHQNNYFFDESLRFNMTLGNKSISDEEIFQLLEKLHLGERIRLLEHGLDEHLNHIKKKFSGGELRRLIIARAFLKKAKVFLLDEITAGLDAQNQQIVLDFIKRQSKEKIVILCTHEQSIIQNGERLFHMSEGKIVDEASII